MLRVIACHVAPNLPNLDLMASGPWGCFANATNAGNLIKEATETSIAPFCVMTGVERCKSLG